MPKTLEQLIALEKDARAYGFEWPNAESIIDQAISEAEEVRAAIADEESLDRVQEEVGDLLHTAISLCLFLQLDVNETIDKIVDKFGARMAEVKSLAKHQGLDSLKGHSTEFMLELWKEAKKIK